MSSRRVRILFVINGTDFGGTESALLLTATRLVRRGHCVHILSLKRPGRIGSRLRDMGVPVSSLGMPETVTPGNLMSGIWRLAGRLRKGRFDLIHSFLPRANIMSRVANRFSAVRRPHFSSERSTDYNRSRIVCHLNRLTGRWTDCVLAVSPVVRQILIERDHLPAEKISTLENGIDIGAVDGSPRVSIRQHLGIRPDQVLFCSVGRLTRVKGLTYLMQALARMRLRAHAQLALVGEGPAAEEIWSVVRSEGLTAQVHLLGFREDVVGILKDSDVLVLPSLQEGVPVVILEAMACSLPVIATDVGGVSDLVLSEETGILVPPAEVWRQESVAAVDDRATGEVVASLSSAMDRLTDDAELRNRFGLRGRNRVEQVFGLDRVVSELESLYVRSLERAGHTDAEVP